jgi:hypothetical protein
MRRPTRCLRVPTPLAQALLCLALAASPAAHAQRHSLGASPPTAPPLAKFTPSGTALPGAPGTTLPGTTLPGTTLPGTAGPVAPVSSGLGAIQFFPAAAGVPAPQTLTRQLGADDERLRSAALASLGAPGQYLGRGHVPYPHSVQLDLVQLGEGDQIDALLTVELDQHIVTAVLVPEGDTWRRVATVLFATSFSNASTTPATFARPLRSWLQSDRYRAVFHAAVTGPTGDFTENEADLNVVHDHAIIVLDFVSGARQCDATGQLRPAHQSCELIQRWLEPDPNDPTHHFMLITATGHFSAHEADDPLSRSRNYRLTRLRTFTCQPFIFSPSGMHFEPSANAAPCYVHEPPRSSEHPDHSDHSDHLDHSEHPDHPDHPEPLHPTPPAAISPPPGV